MSAWDQEAYIASLPDMALDELCKRLRGGYDNGITYGKHPLHHEAARRLEAMQADLDQLRGTIRDELKSLVTAIRDGGLKGEA